MSSRRSNLQSFRVNKDSTNAGLWLDKFIVRQDDVIVNYSEKQAKQTLVDEVSQIKVSNIYESFFNDIWKPSLEKYAPQCIEITGRMIVGLGAESVLETSITLHRTYGVPFIPGSALKGLAASYAHRFMGEDWKKVSKDKVTKETKKIGEAHRLMFGSQESAGYVIFHDALYVPNSYKNKPKNPLETDILTVHHQKYYQGKDSQGNYPPPADWDSPVPIPLLSAQGAYLLAVSANSGDAKFDEKMAKLAVEILELALRDEGIGAKTSSGYGRAILKDYAVKQDKLSANETAYSQPDSEPISEPQISDIEKQKMAAEQNKKTFANMEEQNKKDFANIQLKLLEISNYKKEDKNKFRSIVRDDLSKLYGDLKKQAASLIVERVRKVSELEDKMLENAVWFVTAKKQK